LSNYRIPSLSDIYATRSVVKKYLRQTPLVYAKKLSKLLGCQAYLKLENLQPTGSFKVRGGINYICQMREEATKRGVITASTGNHAQSIAYASQLFGVEAHIVMPMGISQVKVEAVKDLGADVIITGSYLKEAVEHAQQLAKEKGYLFISGSGEPLLYEGVGTMHLEVFEDLPDLDIEIHPIGGGSGASTACIVYKGLKPSTIVIGVQAEGASAFYQSWKAGTIVSTSGVNTKAEGLAVATVNDLPFSILRGRLDDMVLVSDEEMTRAIQMLVLMEGQVAEHAGAAPIAAAFNMRDRLQGRKVVLPVTGRNIQPELLAEITQRKYEW
jgi:threonine dehydratase